ncbi:MAG: zwf2, partial [Microbacterium sp.]|nr:zwf2 [Microbacterium sp.]
SRPRLGARPERRAPLGFPDGLDLPHRPLPRQGDRPEHPGAALRERAVRADLEPQLRRSRPDHHGGGHRRRRPGGLLRRHRRGAGRHPEPPAAAPRPHCDGGADQLRRHAAAGREGEGARGGEAPRGPRVRHRTRSVRRRMAGRREGARLPRRGGDGPAVHHRDVRGDQARDQHAPLGRRAVLPPHRQAAGATGHRDRGRVQALPRAAVRSQRHVRSDFGYGHAFTEASPEAYERLILDVLLGDPPLFPRHEEVELSWKILDPIEKFWEQQGGPLEQYSPGSWGPSSADELLSRDGRTWRRP